MEKLRLPPLPAKMDKKKLLEIYSPKLSFEVQKERHERRLERLFKNADSNVYEEAMESSLINNYGKELEGISRLEDEKYKKKFRVTIAEDEKKAMAGQNRILFRLIAFDKRWLFKDWVKRKILLAEAIDDRGFFDQLADAVKSRKFKKRTQKSYTSEFVEYLLKIAATGISYNSSKNGEGHVDIIYKWLTSFDFDENYDLCKIPALNSLNDFYKFLERNGLR